MLVYSVIMFAAAVLIFAVGFAVYRGRTDLIIDYHQKHVKAEELPAYGRAIGKGLFALGAALALSGIIALFGGERTAPRVSLAVLGAGIILSVIILVCVQKKYNGKILD